MLKDIMKKNAKELYDVDSPQDILKWTKEECLCRYYFDRDLYLLGAEIEYIDEGVKLRLDTFDCTLTGFENGKKMKKEVRSFTCEMITNAFNEIMRRH